MKLQMPVVQLSAQDPSLGSGQAFWHWSINIQLGKLA